MQEEPTTTETEQEPCPEWCASCAGLRPGAAESHFSDLHTIRLELERPKQYDHPVCGVPGWTPSELEVHMDQRFGALWPTIRIGRREASEGETLRLSPLELIDLIAVLTEMRAAITATRAAGAAREVTA